MQKQTFDDAISWLNKYHSHPISKEARAIYWDNLKHAHDDVFSKAVMESYVRFPPGRYPTIENLRSLMAQVREGAWGREKRLEQQELKAPVERPRMTEQIKDSIRLWRRVTASKGDSDKITVKQLAVIYITEMEEKYPKTGWGAMGKKMLEEETQREARWNESNGEIKQETVPGKP